MKRVTCIVVETQYKEKVKVFLADKLCLGDVVPFQSLVHLLVQRFIDEYMFIVMFVLEVPVEQNETVFRQTKRW